MSEPITPTASPRPTPDGQARRPTPPARPGACAPRTPDEAATCPACGEAMRLWANYHRCRNCGYKESCCF